MRAFHQPAADEPPVIGNLPDPTAAPGTVVLRPPTLGGTDAGVAAGMMAGMVAHQYPLVLGRDASGVVESVGEGAEHIAVGDEVVGHAPLMPVVEVGTIAEFAALPAESVSRKPSNVSHIHAAALPLAGPGPTL